MCLPRRRSRYFHYFHIFIFFLSTIILSTQFSNYFVSLILSFISTPLSSLSRISFLDRSLQLHRKRYHFYLLLVWFCWLLCDDLEILIIVLCFRFVLLLGCRLIVIWWILDFDFLLCQLRQVIRICTILNLSFVCGLCMCVSERERERETPGLVMILSRERERETSGLVMILFIVIESCWFWDLMI